MMVTGTKMFNEHKNIVYIVSQSFLTQSMWEAVNIPCESALGS